MYEISDYLRELINDEGGFEKFAEKYGLNPQAVEGYYNGTRKIQETTLTDLAVRMELWKKVLVKQDDVKK